jgi:hypothetical protein
VWNAATGEALEFEANCVVGDDLFAAGCCVSSFSMPKSGVSNAKLSVRGLELCVVLGDKLPAAFIRECCLEGVAVQGS